MIKIVDKVLLSEGQTGLELSAWPELGEQIEFRKWASQNKFSEYLEFKNFYRAGHFGDIDYPAIQVKKDAPEEVITLTLLRWS